MLHLSSDFNLKEWVSVVLGLTREEAPLLERAERGDKVQAPQINYYAQKKLSKVVKTLSAYDDDDTVISTEKTDDSRVISGGYILMNGDERIMVTDVQIDADSIDLTVVRGWGNTPASAISNGAELKIISKAESEFKIKK